MSTKSVTMKSLLEAGVHFGHQKRRWNPKMKKYIFVERSGIYIIDLQKTLECLDKAARAVKAAVADGKAVLFVGTKKQAKDVFKDEAKRCGMPYVTERWLGGMLTNFTTIFERIKELERLEKMRDTGEINKLTKKEGLLIEREITRLLVHLSGVRTMKKVPDLVFVVDVAREATAVHEANLRNIPVVALVDTNCDPRGVDYVIPSNDDAIRAIKLLVGKIAEAVLEGKAARKDIEEEQAAATLEGVTPSMAGRIRLTEESELEDKDLLGESTLAKLGGGKPGLVEEVPQEIQDEEKAI